MARKKAEPKKMQTAAEEVVTSAVKETSAPKKAAPAMKKNTPDEKKEKVAEKTAASSENKVKAAAPKKKSPTPKPADDTPKTVPTEKKESSAPETAPVEKKKPAAKKSAGTKKTAAKKSSAPKKAASADKKDVSEKEVPVVEEPVPAETAPESPRRSVAFIGSECYPFVKTGGLGDVMYALPRELVKQNCDVRVILPRYACIRQQYQDKMVYRGEFYMDLGRTGRNYYVGIMEYVCDGVVYDFIDNQEFFSAGNPYISLVDDIPKYCFFSKAALAALNFMNWIPDIIHCHDCSMILRWAVPKRCSPFTIFASREFITSRRFSTGPVCRMKCSIWGR